ncbi:helix-turn-helix transcriptional regulator [uncultured Flavobacterium sp.]|uniref:helix-turn-helix domain-containing protein n=1 Tax=uncultured Flavobacterium sp. TaxID=165435 RepID=UPI0009634F36|nr:helix-turn-helix transcriptional regulator [uncultured Flavobacterium sp.]OJX38801.1 MAG: DNA-binding protein [Flavobacteriia bacterium 40-80]
MTDQDFLVRLGKSIAEIRKRKGISQNELCAVINMEKSNLSAIENGRQNASSLTLKKIADAMNVEVREFF